MGDGVQAKSIIRIVKKWYHILGAMEGRSLICEFFCLFSLLLHVYFALQSSLLLSCGSLRVHCIRPGTDRAGVPMLYLLIPTVVLSPHLRLFPIHSILHLQRGLFLGFHRSPLIMIEYEHTHIFTYRVITFMRHTWLLPGGKHLY